MKARVAFSLALLWIVAACHDAGAPTESSIAGGGANRAAGARTIDGQYIVVLRDGPGDVASSARALAGAHGASIGFVYQNTIRGFSAQMSEAAAAALARNPTVAYVEQDQEVSLNVVDSLTTTVSVGDVWGLDRIDAAAGLDGFYSYSATGAGVRAYIIDSGILPGHADFGGRVGTSGFTSILDGRGTGDCNGHGTHVAGTVGGTAYGVAKNVTLISVRVLNCAGSGTWSGVIAGVDWVAGNHIKPAVANMSLGGGASASVDEAVRRAIASGVSFAVAAGNGNNGGVAQNACNYSPARVPDAMTIGATNSSDTKASWSNYGSCVDWFAPGVGIKSAWHTGPTATNTISGTSMSSPHVAGVAALYLEKNAAATPLEVRDALFAAATKGIVKASNTANNHLLFSAPHGFGTVEQVNQPPVAAFSFSCVELECSFTNGSHDPDGTTLSHAWNFGDEGTSDAQHPTHPFAAVGTYSVSLTVTDADNASATVTKSVTVAVATAGDGPVLTVTGAKSKGNWSATLAWSGFAEDVVSFDVRRNGALYRAGVAGSTFDDVGKGGGTFTYQVCAAGGTSNCTNVVTSSY